MNENHFNNFKVSNLDVKDVIKKSIGIYKEGYKPFIILSVINFIFRIINSTINYISKLYRLNITIYILSTLITLVLSILFIYLSSRAGVAIYILAEKFLKGRDFTAKDAFEKSKEVIWRYIGVNILYGLILTLPIFCIFLSYKFIQSWMIKYGIIALLTIPTAFLGVRYSFAPISALLKKEKHGYLKYSKILVNGDLSRILFLVVITSLVFIVPYQIYIRVLFDYSKMGNLHKFVASSFNELFHVFTTPFSYIVTVVMYFDLKRNKRIS